MQREDLNFLPVSLNLTGRKVLIIGAGRVALHKAAVLARFTDKALVVARKFDPGFAELPFTQICKDYDPEDLNGIAIAFICTENHDLNHKIKLDAKRYGVLASVCDDPCWCDFISPAILKQDHVTIAVSSNARSVKSSIRIRNAVKTLVDEGLLDLKLD